MSSVPFIAFAPGSQAKFGSGQLLTVQQVAEQLNVSRSLVYTEIKRGKLLAHRLGKCVRIRRQDLDAYLTPES